MLVHTPSLLFVLGVGSVLAMINGQRTFRSAWPLIVGWWIVVVVSGLLLFYGQVGFTQVTKQQWGLPPLATLSDTFRWGILAGILVGGLLELHLRLANRQSKSKQQ